ncbi:MAG: sugar ABC transporter permease [Candidatus Omnitrophica bacterium]|nr:sugar ABC transporter permease [Candidatus Omnitrophota bacterium]MCG2703750.1 sugar ABC transporter permease [Candidatus Omnitrophota bacterium]
MRTGNLLNTIKDYTTSYLFIFPALVIFLVFGLYPFSQVFWLSVHNWDGIALTKSFVGLRNFIEVFKDIYWWQSMWHAGYIAFLALTFQNMLALVLALLVDRGIRGGNAFRVIFYLPPVLSGIVVGLIWSWIYDGNYGLLNHWLEIVGLGNLSRAWLADPKTALTCIGIIHMWKGFGWGFVILLAGLQGIPRELYEASDVDGAGSWHKFVHITIPMMVPVFVLVMILTILGTMQIFDIIVATTNGGPGYETEVPVTRILASMLGSSRFGYACSQAIVFGVILLIVSLIQLKLSKKMKQA